MNKIHQLSLKVIKPNWKKKIPAKKFFFIYIVNHTPPYYKVITSEVYIASKHTSKEEKKKIPVLYLIGEHEIQTVGKMPTWRCFQKVELN